MKLFANILNLKSLTIAVLFLSSFSLNATHIVGGDLTYVCLGDELYEFTLKVRRDCINGDAQAPFDSLASIGFFNEQGFLIESVADTGQILIPITSMETIESTLKQNCSILDPFVCVTEATYKVIVKLPYRAEGYLAVYQRCCRNSILQNISDPLFTGASYFIHLSGESMDECNSSPVFDEWTDIYACLNEDLVFKHTATDVDGDELVYSLCAPTTGATEPFPMPQPPNDPASNAYPYYPTVNWLNGIFSTDNMFGAGTPLTIESNTGLFTARPGMVGTFLIGVCVEEYRNDVLLSRTRRDFEITVLPCGEPTNIDFTYQSLDCETLEYQFTSVATDDIVSYDWDFNAPSNDSAFSSDEMSPMFTFPEEGIYEVEVTSYNVDSTCIAVENVELNVVLSGVVLDFETTIASCEENGVNLVIEDLSMIIDPNVTILSKAWTIFVDGSIVNVPSDQIIMLDDILFETIDITLSIVTNEGCEKSINETYNINDLLPKADFEVVVVQCYSNGFQMAAQDISGPLNPTLIPVKWSWTVDDGSNSQMFMGQSINFDALSPMTIDLEVEYTNGCFGFIRKVIDPYEDLAPTIDISINPQGCDFEESATLDLSAMVSGGSFTGMPDTYNWTIIQNGNSDNYSGQDIEIEITDFDNPLEVNVLITYNNGCQFSETRLLEIGDIIPWVDIDVSNIVCLENNLVDLTLTGNVSNAAGFNPLSFEWTVNNGNIESYTGQVIDIQINAENTLSVVLTITFDNGCITTVEEEINISEDILPTASFDVEITNCDDPNAIVVTVVNTTEYEAAEIEDLLFSYTINGVVFTTSDSTFEIVLSSMDDLDISLDLEFDNDCSATLTLENIDISIPTIDFISDPIFTCMGMEVSLVANPNPNWDYQWDPTNGLSFENGVSDPTVSVMENTTYFVTVSNGACSVEASIDVVIMMESEIQVSGIDNICDGLFDLEIANPIMGAIYQWSETEDFANIIFTGNMFSGSLEDLSGTTLYVRIFGDNPDCLVGMLTLDLIDQSIDIDITEPFMLCYGDTATYIVLNNVPDHNLTYSWIDDHIVSGADTPTPTIGVGFEDETFEIEFTTTNQYGCSITNFVTVIVGETQPITFDYDYEVCGELTVCFTPNGNQANLYIFNFGDPVTGNDNQAIGQTACHTFSQSGDFDITIEGVGTICSGVSITESITVYGDDGVDFSIDGVIGDTVKLCANETLDLDIITNVPDSLITWCDLDGNTVANGGGFTITGSGTADIPFFDGLIVKINLTDECIVSDTLIIDPYDFGPGTDNDALDFTYEVEDCGGLEVCFDANTDAAGNLEWSFGDGATIFGVQSPCHTYTGSGTYEVILMAPNAPCPVEPHTEIIKVFDGPFVTILGTDNDTLNYCFGEIVELEAITNAEMADIQWCNADNMVIGTGPFFTFIGEGDTDIYVKLDGGDDCIDTSLVSLIAYDFGQGTENDSLSFDAYLTECGGLEVCFEANTDAGGFINWDFGDGETSFGIQFVCHTYTGSGTYDVVIDAADAPCFVEPYSDEILILGEEPMLTLDIESDTLFYCLGEPAVIMGMANVPDENITWCDTLGNELGQGSSFVFAGMGTNSFIAKATDGLGCTDSVSFVLMSYDFGPGTDNDTLSFEANLSDCGGLEVCFEANTDAGGNIIWDFGDGTTTDSLQNVCHTYADIGTYTVTISAPGAPCPVVSYTEEITLFGVDPSLEITSQSNNCIDDTYTIIATSNIGAENITWCDDQGNQIFVGDIFEVMITEQTTISVKVSDGLGCGDTLDIVLYPSLGFDDLMIDVSNADCSGDPYDVFITGTNVDSFTYVWGPSSCILGDTIGSSIMVDPEAAKDIFVTITENGTGCDTTLTQEILPGLEGIDFMLVKDPGDTIFFGQEVTVTLVPFDEDWQVEWSTGDENVESIMDMPENTTEYSVTITDENGCVAEVSMEVVVLQPLCTEEDVFLPTAFSPNSDGNNDLLMVRSNFIDEMEIKIVNRWGQIVYQSSDRNEGWDGTYDGEELAPDAFAYWLDVLCVNGERYVTQGNVNLIR